MSSRSEQWSKLMSGEMVLQFSIVCKGLLRLNVCNSSHLKRSKQRRPIRRWRGHRMSRHYFSSTLRATTGLLIGATLCLSSTFAQAGPCTRRNCAIRSCRTSIGKQPICGTNGTPVGRRTTRSSTNRGFHEASRTAAEIKILGEHDPRQTTRRKRRSRRLH